jgi:hypothetical protein
MDHSELDRLDEENRQGDLFRYLDELDEDSNNHHQQLVQPTRMSLSSYGNDGDDDFDEDDGIEEFIRQPSRSVIPRSFRRNTLLRFHNTTSSFDGGVGDDLHSLSLLRRYFPISH